MRKGNGNEITFFFRTDLFLNPASSLYDVCSAGELGFLGLIFFTALLHIHTSTKFMMSARTHAGTHERAAKTRHGASLALGSMKRMASTTCGGGGGGILSLRRVACTRSIFL